MVNRKNAHFKRQIAEMSQAQTNGSGREGSVDVSHTSSLNSTSLSAPNNTSIHPNNYSKDSFAHHSNSVLPPLLQPNNEPLKTDLVALFVDRYVPVPDEEAIAMMEEINDFLESMECFVFENKKFVRLPEKGIFNFDFEAPS